jgi:2-(1,2-epoxy-1,2-dihydrophenyl)acetyl-CoA isomerase
MGQEWPAKRADRKEGMAADVAQASPPVLLEALEGGVLNLTLNRPDRLNAFTVALHESLAEALERAAGSDDCRVVLLSGAGKGFCAGQDLTDRAVAPDGVRPDLGEALDKRYNPLIRTLRSLPKPIVCAVNGVAAGAGANIALACDIALAARSARFIQAFARLALVADSGGSWFLPRLIGEARARALMMLADPISAEDAAAWGMIYRVVDDDQLMGAAHEIAHRLAAGPTHAYGLMKRAFAASPTNSLDDQLDLERDLQREAGQADEYLEGVRAFLEKRQPDFRTKQP